MADSVATKTSKDQSAAASEKRAPEVVRQAEATSAQGQVLALQRAAGNRAVASLLESAVSGATQGAGVIQRKCARCAAAGSVCSGCKDEQNILQRKATGQAAPGSAVEPAQTSQSGNEAPSPLRTYISQTMGRGRPLESGLRRSLESSYRRSLGHVRIHTDAAAARASERLGAEAFTLGNTIWFGRRRYQPDTARGRHLLAHEVAHTIQQQGHSPSVQTKLLIGSPSDASERAADRAADAVIRRQPVPGLSSSAGVIRRKVKSTSSGAHNDEKIVEMDDGTRYRVTRKRTITPKTRKEFPPTRVTPKFDEDNVTVRIEWCRGTQGSVEIGANAPAQVRDLLQRISGVIQRGGNGSDVLEEIKDTEVTPFINFDIARSGSWTVTGGVDVTVGREGVTAGGGKIGIKKGPVDIDIAGRGGEGGTTITGRVTITPGRKDREFKCDKEVVELVQHTEYQCERQRDVPASKEPRTRTVDRTLERSRYIYFNYATDVINEKQSAAEIGRLSSDLGEGFAVSNIKAFTSPEGPMAPSKTFRGNEKLARDRAEAAMRRVKSLCAKAEAASCFIGGEDAISPTGEGELYTIIDPATGREVEGRRLEEHAVEEFLEEPAEERHRTPELVEELEGPGSSRKKAAKVYPLLRRAVITLNKTVKVEEEYMEEIPAHTEKKTVTCPEDVLEAAKSNFRISDSLTK